MRQIKLIIIIILIWALDVFWWGSIYDLLQMLIHLELSWELYGRGIWFYILIISIYRSFYVWYIDIEKEF